MPALWLVLLSLVVWLTPLRAALTVSALVVPLPFLAVQATLNGGYFADPLGPRAPPRWSAWRRWPLVAVGAGLSFLASRTIDRSAYSFATTLASAGERTASSDWAIGLPRNSGSRKIPEAPDWSKTYLSSPGLSVRKGIDTGCPP